MTSTKLIENEITYKLDDYKNYTTMFEIRNKGDKVINIRKLLVISY